MDIPRELRMELNALSKEVFGTPSRWQKLLSKGTDQLLTKKVTETIPGKEGEESTTKESEVPILTKSRHKQFFRKYYTLDEVHQMLLTYKQQLDNMKAEMKKQQDEKEAKEAQEKAIVQIKEAAQGSAVV